MSVPTISFSTQNLINLGLRTSHTIHYQLSPDELIADTLRMGEGILNDTGALVVQTGEFTGRTPKDKFIVKDEITANKIDWNEFNIPLAENYFDIIFKKITDYLNRQPEIWIRDAYACADEYYRLNVRVISEKPWNDLFAHNMFIRPSEEELDIFKAGWHILSAPGLRLNPKECGTRQHNASIISFKHKTVLIAGTGYTGEVKKAIFTVLNFILPQYREALSMHCAANIGDDGDTALFFGLSGTGKTTLSADPNRMLIGDDEHGWAQNNIFNFEGGCYAKTIDLNEEREPEIYHAIRSGAMVENTTFIPGTNKIDFAGRSITENTRVSYPLHYISNAVEPATGGIPTNIFFLTCDANGILPPISRLTPEQAMYQFISGYTAKVAGTEAGVTAPKSTFSACFGAPFLPLHPGKYAAMLGDKLRKYQVRVWLINTGWTGGSYGIGNRIKIAYTRAMITAALEGRLEKVIFQTDPVFGFKFPTSCPNVPNSILNPKNTWLDKKAYDDKAIFLAKQFNENFEKYATGVSQEVRDAAPTLYLT